jgi:hypothetical protein
MVLLIFMLFFLAAVASLSTNIWLAKWTDQAKKEAVSNNETSSTITKIRGLSIYSSLGIFQGNKLRKEFLLFHTHIFP